MENRKIIGEELRILDFILVVIFVIIISLVFLNGNGSKNEGVPLILGTSVENSSSFSLNNEILKKIVEEEIGEAKLQIVITDEVGVIKAPTTSGYKFVEGRNSGATFFYEQENKIIIVLALGNLSQDKIYQLPSVDGREMVLLSRNLMADFILCHEFAHAIKYSKNGQVIAEEKADELAKILMKTYGLILTHK